MRDGITGVITAVVVSALITATPGSASDPGRAIDNTASRSGSGLLTFTDSSTYNALDFAGSPIGIMEKMSSPVRLDLAYRYLDYHHRSSADSMKSTLRAGVIPRLTVGVPDAVYLCAWYAPYRTEQDSNQYGVQRFGFSLGGGASSRILTFGISGAGSLGEVKRENTSDHRHVLGVENIGLYVGSQVHRLVRIGFHGAASGWYDSLSKAAPNDTTFDRFFSGAIPRIGGDIDLGAAGFPVQSNFALEWSYARFMYATKRKIGNSTFDNYTIDPISRDSLRWNWQTRGSIPVDQFAVQPAFTFGFRRSNIQRYDTISDNDNPMEFGREKRDTSWRMSSFHWGLGTGFSFRRWIETGVEYTWSNLKMEPGRGFRTASDESRIHHRFALGTVANLDAISALRFPSWLNVAVRMGFLNMLGNDHIDAYRSADFLPGYDQGNPLAVNTQTWRYTPDSGIGGYERVTRFSLGLGAGFFERMLSLDMYTAWVGRESEKDRTGFEFGADVVYEMR